MDIENLLRCFNARDVEYVIIGALAMPVHGYFRASRDIDLFIRATDENARKTMRALEDAGYDVTDLSVELVMTRKLLFRQYALRTDIHPYVLGAGFEGVSSRAVNTRIGEVETRVASLDDLISMKTAAGRPKDLEDLKALEKLRQRGGGR